MIKRKYFLICLLLYTQLRGMLLVIMPFVPRLVKKYLSLKVSPIYYVLIVLYIMSTVQGFYYGYTSFSNILLSYWLFLPLLYLFCLKVDMPSRMSLILFMKYSSNFLVIVDLLGLIWKIITGGEDEFGFAYGRHYEYVHGLAMVNILYVFYYAALYLKGKQHTKDIKGYGLFFFFSFICCSFGLSFIVLLVTILWAMLLERKKVIIVPFVLLCSLSAGLYYSDFFEYERNNIEFVFSQKDNARKMLMFDNYISLVNRNPSIWAFGTGPGGFNSRATVLLDGDSENLFTKIEGVNRPLFYKKYIYPLWNKSFVSQNDYSDGTRNKPFSSIIAIFSELGFFFGMIIVWLFCKRIFLKKVSKMSPFEYFVLLMDIFMFISCILHEWFVSTEFIVYLILRLSTQNQILKKKREISMTEPTLKRGIF